jgi:hypothetical protein
MAQSENAAQAVFRVTGKCLLAQESVEKLSYIDPEKRRSEKTKYEHHLLEAIASALSIKDEFYKGVAIRQVINVCRNANELDIEKTLFKEVDHDFLREQIVRDAPPARGKGFQMRRVLAEPLPYIWMVSTATRSSSLSLKLCATSVRPNVRSKVSRTTSRTPTTTPCWPRRSTGEHR